MKTVLATLTKHADDHRLVQRAREGFRAWVDEAVTEGAADLPTGWNYGQLTAQLASLSLCFRPESVDYPFVDTRLNIQRYGINVGHYRLITGMDGSEIDDYFVMPESTE